MDAAEPIRIPLRNRKGAIVCYALVDADDHDQIARGYSWSFDGSYAMRGVTEGGRGRKIYLHREIMGLVPGDGVEVDHKNRDKLDCRRSNLRIASHAENGQNRSARTDGSSRYRGVSWASKRGKWRADVRINRRQHSLGYFDNEEDANAAVCAFRAEHLPFSEEAMK